MSNQERPPALAPELVNEFVGAGHGNLDKVKELLNQEPNLLNASWDWGGGSWETALGAAAHIGQREIAQYLLSEGSQMTIHAAAMLGELELVKAILKIHPEALTSGGAHGIPLLRHAEVGGEHAKHVLEYLQSLITA